jgi:hypothetical protein
MNHLSKLGQNRTELVAAFTDRGDFFFSFN